MGLAHGIGIGIPFKKKSSGSWQTYWATLISALVDVTDSTKLNLTFPTGKPSLLSTDLTCTVNGVARAVISSLWLGGVWTIVLESGILVDDVVVLTFAKTGQTANATNNLKLLDSYTGAAGAYSLRKINSSYSGSCIRVLRFSDTTQSDIGFNDNNLLDTEALLEFVGNSTGYIVKWYDQSGNGKDIALVAGSAAMPIIVIDGDLVTQANGVPAITTDATSRYLFATIDALINAPALSIFIAHAPALAAAANTNTSVLWHIGNANVSTNLLAHISSTALLSREFMAVDCRSTAEGNRRLGSTVYRRSAGEMELSSDFILTAGISMYKNGEAINLDLTSGGAATNVDYTPATGNVSNLIYFGCLYSNSATSGYTEDKFSEIIIYPSDKSANKAAIEDNISDFFFSIMEVSVNPYSSVSFATQYKANLHTHTDESDGANTPELIAQKYSLFGYKVLSLTDHDTWRSEPDPTWPLSNFSDMEPQSADYNAEYYPDLDLLMIRGNELTNDPKTIHHRQSLFCGMWTPEQIAAGDFATYKNNIPWTLAQIGAMGGLSILNHPSYHTGYDLAFYTDLFDTVASLLGIEVINGTVVAQDEDLWDDILNDQMPTRQVFGFAHTDDHNWTLYCGKQYLKILTDALTGAKIKTALQSGHFYFVHDPEGTNIARHNPEVTPIINSITINESKNQIVIDASNCSKIEWIRNKEVVQEGDTFILKKSYYNFNYIRAKLTGVDGSFAYTQAFGIGLKA